MKWTISALDYDSNEGGHPFFLVSLSNKLLGPTDFSHSWVPLLGSISICKEKAALSKEYIFFGFFCILQSTVTHPKAAPKQFQKK